MKMVAVEKDDRFVLNGTKTWVTSGSVADMGLFWVYTDKEKRTRGISCFIVDLKDTLGVSAHLIEELGLHCCRAAEVAFQDVEMPKDCLLGDRGEGYGILMETLGETRLCAGARALGLGQACLDDCISFIKERKQAGQKIGNQQLVEAKVAEMYIEHEAARMLIYQAAANKDRGAGSPLDVPTAKYVACEAAVKAAETAMGIHASYGFPLNMALRRYMNDSRCFPITEGTRNILRIIISGALLR
jgi:glutaryl-CoA dehydrogenase (non-decarboxylating)